MPIRNSWRRGDYLVQDDGTGATIYASQARKLWNGTIQHRDHYETRQPQEFVRAKYRDPYPVPDPRSAPLVSAAVVGPTVYVGQTTIAFPTGPATHLYDLGIGDMKIGSTFIVR